MDEKKYITATDILKAQKEYEFISRKQLEEAINGLDKKVFRPFIDAAIDALTGKLKKDGLLTDVPTKQD